MTAKPITFYQKMRNNVFLITWVGVALTAVIWFVNSQNEISGQLGRIETKQEVFIKIVPEIQAEIKEIKDDNQKLTDRVLKIEIQKEEAQFRQTSSRFKNYITESNSNQLK